MDIYSDIVDLQRGRLREPLDQAGVLPGALLGQGEAAAGREDEPPGDVKTWLEQTWF